MITGFSLENKRPDRVLKHPARPHHKQVAMTMPKAANDSRAKIEPPCGEVPAITDFIDSAILEAERRAVTYINWINDQTRLTDDEANWHCDIARALENFIADTPVYTVGGIAAKVRWLQRTTGVDEDMCVDDWTPRRS
jgi:hypothetical protein